MKDFAKIPTALILEMDDVGWIDGRDLRGEGKASRSGLDRNHVIEDYVYLKNLSKTIGKKVAAAIVAADWDKENVLRGEVGITHDPAGWDQASKIDVAEHEKCLAALAMPPRKRSKRCVLFFRNTAFAIGPIASIIPNSKKAAGI